MAPSATILMRPRVSHESQGSQSSAASDISGSKKRNQTNANLDNNGHPKPVKRRAAKACAACRARKVRCDVMQRYHVTADGEVTCSNCTMDGIRCVIEESKRRKKHLNGVPINAPIAPAQVPAINGEAQTFSDGTVKLTDVEIPEVRRWSGSTAMSNDIANNDFTAAHVPHPIYQNVNQQMYRGDINHRNTFTPGHLDPDILLASASISGDRTATRIDTPPAPPLLRLKHQLPEFLKPLPQRITSVDIDYLDAKGALSLPEVPFRNALLRAYLEYVSPYMPVLEIHDFLQIVEDGTGHNGRISLLLFQAVMFAGTAFVDMEHLRNAGYSNRKAARKVFFQKARVLYDFDYDVDRVSLVQSLVLMTYWYETPDDQKDTWHWMGVAISLAHTIGLHRNPENSNMEPNKKKLWKRIWWSCFMRDRLIALGMRRPTRIKDEDYDVPMLTEEDFESWPISENMTIVSPDCTIMRDSKAQKKLAQMCIAKAKLCLCIGHVLSAQYSVLVKAQGMQGQEGSTRSTVMLFPKKLDQTDDVKRCDDELKKWVDELPESCAYSDEMEDGHSSPPIFVQQSLLHMVYFTTLSALHRPQVHPSVSSIQADKGRELQDLSQKKVRESSREITRISAALHTRGLEKYLPTTGVTVLLPAVIIHLLDIKANNDEAREAAKDGFCQCMQVLQKLRDSYASADYATQFLEAAIRKADIDIAMGNARERIEPEDIQATLASDKIQEFIKQSKAARHTPPPTGDDHQYKAQLQSSAMMDLSIPGSRPMELNALSAHTPPDTDTHANLTPLAATDSFTPATQITHIDFSLNVAGPADLDMNEYINFDTGGETWAFPHGESGGVINDMNWIDQETLSWSRLTSPTRDLGRGKEHMKWEEEPGGDDL